MFICKEEAVVIGKEQSCKKQKYCQTGVQSFRFCFQ